MRATYGGQTMIPFANVLTYTEDDAKAAKPLADWLMAAVRRIEAEEAQQGSFDRVDFRACQAAPVGDAMDYDFTRVASTGSRHRVTHAEGLTRVPAVVQAKWSDEGKIHSVQRVWLGAKLVYDARIPGADDISTAKPALAGLSREAGQKARGIGWCDA